MEAIADTIDALKGSLEWFVQLSSYQGLFFMPSCDYPSSSFNTFLNWNVNKTVVKDTARKSAIGSAIYTALVLFQVRICGSR